MSFLYCGQKQNKNEITQPATTAATTPISKHRCHAATHTKSTLTARVGHTNMKHTGQQWRRLGACVPRSGEYVSHLSLRVSMDTHKGGPSVNSKDTMACAILVGPQNENITSTPHRWLMFRVRVVHLGGGGGEAHPRNNRAR